MEEAASDVAATSVSTLSSMTVKLGADVDSAVLSSVITSWSVAGIVSSILFVVAKVLNVEDFG